MHPIGTIHIILVFCKFNLDPKFYDKTGFFQSNQKMHRLQKNEAMRASGRGVPKKGEGKKAKIKKRK